MTFAFSVAAVAIQCRMAVSSARRSDDEERKRIRLRRCDHPDAAACASEAVVRIDGSDCLHDARDVLGDAARAGADEVVKQWTAMT
jgi:hypothetical protein